MSQLTNSEAVEQLIQLRSEELLAETLIDAFHRGDIRALFCNEEGEVI